MSLNRLLRCPFDIKSNVRFSTVRQTSDERRMRTDDRGVGMVLSEDFVGVANQYSADFFLSIAKQ